LIVDHFRKSKKCLCIEYTEEFSIFSIMSDDSLSIENKIIADQVQIDIKKIIEELC
jgi:RNA polymerase sigma-70 factor (ECF subfamily)